MASFSWVCSGREVWDAGECALLATRPRGVVAFDKMLLFAEPKLSVCCDLPPRSGARCVADVALHVQSWVELARMSGSNFVWLGFLLYPPCPASPVAALPTCRHRFHMASRMRVLQRGISNFTRAILACRSERVFQSTQLDPGVLGILSMSRV